MRKCPARGSITRLLAASLIAAALLATGCENATEDPTPGPLSVDTSGLISGITQAKELRDATEVSTNGADVHTSQKWVTQAVKTAFTTAITAAQTAADKSDATQAEIDAALAALNTAKTTFTDALRDGTSVANKTALNRAITEAQELLDNTAVSADGADLLTSEKWVSQAAQTALTNAIATAQTTAGTQDATQAAVDEARTALNTAISVFINAIENGTGAKAALLSAITAAEKTPENILVSIDGADVLVSEKWVTQAALTTFTTAISAAQTVADKSGALQAEFDAALAALNTAKTTFTTAAQAGTGAKAALLSAIAEAEGLQASTKVSTDGMDVLTSQKWALQAAKTAFDSAITTAKTAAETSGALQKAFDDALTALNTAKTTFTSASSAGSLADKAALRRAITEAQGLLTNTEVSTDGTEVSIYKKWVNSQTYKDDLSDAIVLAQAVVDVTDITQPQTDVDNAKIALTTAINVFKGASKYGFNSTTGSVKDITITLYHGAEALSESPTVNIVTRLSHYTVSIGSGWTDIAWYLNNSTKLASTDLVLGLPTSGGNNSYLTLTVEAKKDGLLCTGNWIFKLQN
ncbi:putative lipoprotein [Treponema primitia ZAS-2]|uniref:Putative lipoprotein n=1 Tax=Treponema primitia (strain ATCC BAA-887 / DSM 12427 / ZAS-2) TaxID=545694 RepID=F5YH67_TREPZ|nr:FIVAR domain-containing protein [Treponema primitia]AEF87021.1 putative lipoprotein [Treponema primitia ZAS-2]